MLLCDNGAVTPSPLTRRRRVVGIVAAVLAIVALYVTVVVLYARSGDVESGTEQAVEPDEMVLVLTPVEVDASANRMSARLEPQLGHLGSSSADTLTLDEDIHVLVTGTDGARLIEFRAGEVVAPVTVNLILDGYIEAWPFDRYTTSTMIVPLRTDADGEGEPIPYRVIANGSVPGWDILATGSAVPEDSLATSGASGSVPVVVVELVATRSASTVAFGVVLLALLVIAPVLVLTAAITVLRGRRKVEATMLSWIGAMLFATIPLRNFLPGSPPIGSWVDYLIVLWVFVGLITGLVIFVIAWLRDGPAGVAVTGRDGQTDAAASADQPSA